MENLQEGGKESQEFVAHKYSTSSVCLQDLLFNKSLFQLYFPKNMLCEEQQ